MPSCGRRLFSNGCQRLRLNDELSQPFVGSIEGIRVNSISAGPIKTLASAGIGSFKKILDEVSTNAPLRRNVTIEDVGNTGAFLCSDLAAGITGENIYVDSGYNIVSMGVVE